MTHANLKMILAFVDGELPAEPASALRAHLKTCGQCSRLRDAVIRHEDLLARRLATSPPASPARGGPAPAPELLAGWIDGVLQPHEQRAFEKRAMADPSLLQSAVRGFVTARYVERVSFPPVPEHRSGKRPTRLLVNARETADPEDVRLTLWVRESAGTLEIESAGAGVIMDPAFSGSRLRARVEIDHVPVTVDLAAAARGATLELSTPTRGKAFDCALWAAVSGRRLMVGVLSSNQAFGAPLKHGAYRVVFSPGAAFIDLRVTRGEPFHPAPK